MNSELAHSLWITAIGMGLVLASLLLLWGFMSLLVRLTRGRGQLDSPLAKAARPAPPEHVVEQRRRAAVAAVAVALARTQKPAPRPPQRDSTVSMSPWQAAHRRAGSRGRRSVE